jgi:hypothetical protein
VHVIGNCRLQTRRGEVKKVSSGGWTLGDGGGGKKLSVWAELYGKLKHIQSQSVPHSKQYIPLL